MTPKSKHVCSIRSACLTPLFILGPSSIATPSVGRGDDNSTGPPPLSFFLTCFGYTKYKIKLTVPSMKAALRSHASHTVKKRKGVVLERVGSRVHADLSLCLVLYAFCMEATMQFPDQIRFRSNFFCLSFLSKKL